MNIDELALKVGLAHFDDFENEGKHLMVDTYCINSQLLSFARALIAEYEADQGEAVAVVDANDEAQWADILPDRSVKVGQKLYARPDPNVKELEAEVARLIGLDSDRCRVANSYIIDNARYADKVAELERQLAEARKVIEMKNFDMMTLRDALDTEDWIGEVRMIDFLDSAISIDEAMKGSE